MPYLEGVLYLREVQQKPRKPKSWFTANDFGGRIARLRPPFPFALVYTTHYIQIHASNTSCLPFFPPITLGFDLLIARWESETKMSSWQNWTLGFIALCHGQDMDEDEDFMQNTWI
ncbi:hypothetical protein VNO80_18376 [Phaseolus coccineus]|uniref:Uncharacterized protein n=1 Tax=Phaseolus coccineus TaxID=3886 RepID=A0AAN9ME35_PHACN